MPTDAPRIIGEYAARYPQLFGRSAGRISTSSSPTKDVLSAAGRAPRTASSGDDYWTDPKLSKQVAPDRHPETTVLFIRARILARMAQRPEFPPPAGAAT